VTSGLSSPPSVRITGTFGAGVMPDPAGAQRPYRWLDAHAKRSCSHIRACIKG